VRSKKYGDLLHQLLLTYSQLTPLNRLTDYINECAYGIEILSFINSNIKPLAELAANDSITEDSLNASADKLLLNAKGFFKNYNGATDKKMMAAMLRLFQDSVPASDLPDFYKEINKKHKANHKSYSLYIFKKSVFVSYDRMQKLLTDFSHKKKKKITRDPAWKLASGFANITKLHAGEYSMLNPILNSLQRKYMQAQREMLTNKKFYPDANLTLRLAYGSISGYQPADGTFYNYQTTLDGIIEKANPLDPEFKVPAKLIDLYKEKDYGKYGKNGVMPVAFIADNHTTGGNSGSPVLNANGELIGINFDRTWEGTMSDVTYNSKLCRNIILDVRYTLFIIDKFAGAEKLLSEMRIVQ